jgi:hypothetical protein
MPEAVSKEVQSLLNVGGWRDQREERKKENRGTLTRSLHELVEAEFIKPHKDVELRGITPLGARTVRDSTLPLLIHGKFQHAVFRFW